MRSSISFLVSLLLVQICFARSLTWKEAIELTQKNNPDLQAVMATYNASLESEKAAIAGFLPRVSASTHGGETGTPSGPSLFAYTASLNYSQNLFSGFSDVNNYRIKKLAVEQAKLDLNNAKARISQELKQVFAQAYYSQLDTKLTEDILKRRIENLRSVQLQYDVGRENKGSLLLSQANVDSAKLDVVHAENDKNVTFENLRRYLGIADEEITIQTNIEKENLSSEKPNFANIAEKNYLVLKAKNDELNAQYNLNVSRAQLSPSLDFNASYGYADTKFFPKNDTWSMGLTLSIPLFSGFSDYAAYSANQYKLKSSNNSLQNILLTTQQSLKSKYNDYSEALLQEQVDTSFNQAAVMRAEIARNKYKTGLLSFEDWDLIENDLILKQKQFLSTELNRIVKQSLWEQAQGIGVFQ